MTRTMHMIRLLIVNGPNLNLLGTREPGTYGTDTLDELEASWRRHATARGVSVRTAQSNHEGTIIDELHAAIGRCDGVVINPGAFSHYSYAIHDAIVATALPTVEVHISNIYEREAWRHTSVTSTAAMDTVYGRGVGGYLDAIDHLAAHVTHPAERIAYDDHSDGFGDLRVTDGDAPTDVAVLVHGGFWRDVWKRDIMSPLAAHLADAGWSTYNIEYRRGPGTYPVSASDVHRACVAVRDILARRGRDVGRVVAIGHSAGGYLAAVEACRPDTAIDEALALAPVLDLPGLSVERADDDPVTPFIGETRDSDPERWDAAAVPTQPKAHVTIVHGEADTDVPHAHSVSYAHHATNVDLISLPAVGHMELIRPTTAAAGEVIAALDALRTS